MRSVPLCRLQAIGRTLSDAANSAGIFSSSQAAAYWSYHITRSGFFAIQGIAGQLSMLQAHARCGGLLPCAGAHITGWCVPSPSGPEWCTHPLCVRQGVGFQAQDGSMICHLTDS